MKILTTNNRRPTTRMQKTVMILLLVVSCWSLVTPVFAQSVMSSGTYKIESDSLNSGGIRSTSGTYGVEDTAGEVGTGRSNSSSLGLFEAGYQGMRTDVAAPTVVPPSAPTNLSATAMSS